MKRRRNNESKNGAHLFGVDDAFDVFGQRRTGAEEADEHGQVHESLSAPHLHLPDSAVAPLLPGFREGCACWGGGARTDQQIRGVHVGSPDLPVATERARVPLSSARALRMRHGVRTFQ